MRIGYLVQQFVPEVGAGPARVAEMALDWKAKGADVTILTAMPNRPEGRIHAAYRGKLVVDEEWNGLRVIRSWLYASPKHGFARTIANNASFMLTSGMTSLAKAPRFDVLIASSPPFFPHLTGAALGTVRRTPLILELRDLWPDYLVDMGVLKARPLQRALFGLERFLLGRADHTVVVTDSFRRRVLEKGVASDRIDVIPNGVDASFYKPSVEAPPVDALRRTADEKLVGYLGNFGAGQGLSAVLEAAEKLAHGAPVRFVLVGDGPERRKLETQVAERGLRNVFIGPPIPKEKTRAFYNACDVCLVPLAPVPVFQETIPSKIFEVMACGRPLLASLSGEGERIVEESGGGLAVPPGDSDAIARGIRQLIELSPEARQEMAERGRAYVIDRYSRSALAEKYLRVMERVVARAKAETA